MPQKEIFLSTDRSALGRAEKAASFEVRSDGKKLGELHISKGAIRWYPTDSKGGHYKLYWEKFAELMATQKRSK